MSFEKATDNLAAESSQPQTYFIQRSSNSAEQLQIREILKIKLYPDATHRTITSKPCATGVFAASVKALLFHKL
jgi:hypothetical protein